MKTKTPYAKLLLLILVFSFLTGSTNLFGQILFQSSFEGANPFAGWSNSQSCCSYSVTATTNHPKDGNQSFRSEVRTNDPAVSSGYRAELTLPNVSDQGDMWYGWSMYFEGNNSSGNSWTGSSGVTTQWHPNNGSGSAELAIYADGGQFDITTNPSGGAGGTHQTSGLQNIVANRWYDIVFHVNWASSGGSVQVWIDGQLYFTKNNLNWLPGPYLKLGMNRWLMTNTWVVYYDNFKVGRNVTYNDVAPTPSTSTGNQTPTANAGTDKTLTLPTNSTTLTGSGTDPDGTIAGYAWTRVSGPTTFTFGTANAATTTLSNLVQGVYVFRLTVTDNGGATATDNVTVTVNAAPQSPIANAGSNITLTLPVNSTTLTGSGTDPDGTIAGYAWIRVSGPTTFTLGNANASVTALTGLVLGTYVFRLTVTDNSGLTATDDITVTVNPAANQAPTANAGSNITLTLPTNSTTLSGSGSDPDGTIASYAWSRVSGPTTFTLGSAAAATTTLSGLVQGVYTFRLTVTDNSGAVGTDDMIVTVNAAANQSPTANAGNNIVITLPINSTTLTGSGSDPDGTIANYAWSRVSGPTTFTFANAASASTALSNLVQGVYTFRLTVTDNNGATATDDVNVTVNASTQSNQAPIANAGSNIVISLPVNSTTLNGSNSIDLDGTITIYAWSYVSGPATYSITNAAAATTTLTGLVPGTYVFRLTVTDNGGATDIDNIVVTVNAAANQIPAANAGNNIVITLPVNSTTLTGSGSDLDGTITTYAWSRVSGPTTFAFANAASAATALNNLVQGSYVFRLTVTDNNGATGIDDVNVTVNPAQVPNQLPVARAGNDIVMTLPVNATTLNGNASTDPDGVIVSYSWSRVSGPATFSFTSAGSIATGLNNLVQGVYVFRLTITDNSGATATDNVTVTVNAAVASGNQPPTARISNDIVLTLPVNSTSLSGTGSTDADGTIVGYEWSQLSGPSQVIIGNRLTATSSVDGLTIGEYIFSLKVTDNNGATSTAVVKVTVRDKSGSEIFLNLYPNPASANLTLQYSESTNGKLRISVYDATRRLVKDEAADKSQVTFTKTIDVNILKGGSYILQILLPDGKTVAKQFIKM